MKKLLSFLLLVSLMPIGYAQIIPDAIGNYVSVGRNLLNQSDIVAFKTTFDATINTAVFDSVSNTVLIDFRDDKTATTCYYDLENHRKKWEKTYKTADCAYSKTGRLLFCFQGNSISLIDEETGSPKFSIGRGLRALVASSEENWVLCATERSVVRGTKDLHRIDLNTNSKVWKRKLVVDQDLVLQSKLNDSVFLFIGDGLHAVNENDGSGWSCKLVTEETDHYYSYASGLINVYSPPYVDTTSIYMAGANEVVRLDHQGNPIWRTKLPKAKTSHSMLTVFDDLLVMVNQGLATIRFYGMKVKVKWGKPFIAAFDINSGDMIYFHERSKHADYILDALVKDGFVYVVLADKEGHQSVEKYMIDNGSLMYKMEMTSVMSQAAGELGPFVGKDLYTRVDSALVRLIEVDTVGIYVETEMGVLHVDPELKNPEMYYSNEFYHYWGKSGGLRLFLHGDKTSALDADDREVAVFDFPKVFCAESEIYSIRDRVLYVISREQLKNLY